MGVIEIGSFSDNSSREQFWMINIYSLNTDMNSAREQFIAIILGYADPVEVE